MIYDELAIFVLALVLCLLSGKVLDGPAVGCFVGILWILKITDLGQIPIEDIFLFLTSSGSSLVAA